MNTKEVLLRAAEVVQERGLYKGNYARGNGVNGPVCLIGSINVAVSGGNPWHEVSGVQEACEVVKNFLPKQYHRDIADWNDKPRRRKHEVVAILRKAADSL